MIELTSSLSRKVNKILGKDFNDNQFTIEELNSVNRISLSRLELEYIDYFKGVILLELDSFPSINNEDIKVIASKLPNLRGLKIKEQNALFDLDLEPIQYLEELCLIHNDNLININGLDKIRRFTFYDNKDFNDIKLVVDFLINNKESTITLDITYYVDIVNILYKLNIDDNLLDRITWVESSGLRKYYNYEYTNAEITDMLKNLSSIVSKYIYSSDSDIQRFGILYYWIINNIKFVNEDDPNGENVSLVKNINKVLNYQKGGRLSFAKAFQMVLSFAGIKSSVVYSLGAIDDIGIANGEKIYSLLGESDYAVLRVTLDNRDYYCDIAWDSVINENNLYDKLRLFLFSKEELKRRHKFIGEANIENTYSYHGDDCDDLLLLASKRIKEVDSLFETIEKLKPQIDSKELNIAIKKYKVKEIKSRLNEIEINSQEYKDFVNEMIDLEETIDSEDIELIKLNKDREGIVKSFGKDIIDRYLSNFSLVEKGELLRILAKRLDMRLISQYMYDILVICLKETA